MKNSKAKNNKGITLVALIITVIVLLILAVVAIGAVQEDGIIGKAKYAREEYEKAQAKENSILQGYLDKINENSGNGGSGNIEGEDIIGVDGEIFTAIYTSTQNYTDINGDTAIIPMGFSVGKSEGINTIEEGLVIQDEEGNQFVWIPVTYTATGELDGNGLDSGFLEIFKSNNEEDEYYSEGYSDGQGTEEAADYYDMMLSVQENKGFYIGRYEAGIEQTGTPRTQYADSNRTAYRANGESDVVIKRDCYPYNFVAWGKSMSDYASEIKFDFDSWSPSLTGLDQGHGAVYLSKHLLDGKTTGATSTLCYGLQWNAMLKFMGKDTETDSSKWGNYYESEVIINRPTARWTDKAYYDTTWTLIGQTAIEKNFEFILLTTGASDEFKVKNIYDVAGNCFEWTIEYASSDARIRRGR